MALKKSPAAISLSGSRVNSKNQFVGYGGNNEQARQVTRRRTFSQEELSSKSDKYKCEGRKLQHGHQNVKGKTSVNNVKEYTDDSKRTTFGVEGNFDSNKTFVPGNQSLGYRLSQNSTVDHFCSVQMAHISNQAFGNGTSRAETKNQCNINTDANNNELSPLNTTQDKATYQLRSVDVTCNAESQIESNIDTSINLNCNIKQTVQTDRSSSQQALSNIYSTFNVAQDQVSDTSAMDISSDMEIEDNIICQVPIPSQNDGYCLPSSPNPNQTVTSIYSGINENGHNFISKAAGKAQIPADQVQMSDSTNARSMEHNETDYCDWKQPSKEQAALHQRNADLSGPVPRTVHSLFPVGDNEQVTIDSMDQSSKSQLVTNLGQENSTFKRKRASLVVEGQRSICPSDTLTTLHGRSTMLKSQKRQFIDVCERDSCPRETKGQGLPKGSQKSIKKKRFPTPERGGTIVAMGLPEDQKYANCSRPERQEASMLKGSGGCREGGTFAMSEGQETEVTKKSQGDVEDLDSSVSVGQETMISKELQIQQESLIFSGPEGQTKQSDGGDLEPDSSISEGNKPMIFKESQEEVESCTVPGVGRKRFFNPKYNNPEFNITASLDKCGQKKFVSSLSMNGTSSSNCTESASDQDESNEKKSPSWDKDLADKIKLRLIEMIKDTKMDRKEQSRVYCMLLALNSSFLISDYNKASPCDRERCNKLKSWLSKAKGTWRQGEKSKMARYVLERLSIANVLGIKRSDSAEALAYVEETWRQSKKNRQSIRRSSSRKERGNARNSGQKDQHKRKGGYQRCMKQKLRHLKFGEQSYNKQMSGKESHDQLDCCAQPNYHEHYSAPGGLEERDLRQLKMDEKSSSEVTDGENIMIEGDNDYIQQDSDSNDSHEQLRHEPTYKQVLGQRSRENSEIEISNHSRQSNARNRVGRASRWDQRLVRMTEGKLVLMLIGCGKEKYKAYMFPFHPTYSESSEAFYLCDVCLQVP